MIGYKRSGNSLYFEYPNGKMIMVGQSKMIENFDNIFKEFNTGKDKFLKEDSLWVNGQLNLNMQKVGLQN